MVEADQRGLLADEEIEAGGEVAFLDPRLARPGGTCPGEGERRAFRADEEAFPAEAGDEVGAGEVAGQFESRDHGGEGFERKVARGGFDQHAGRSGSDGRQGLAQFQGEQVATFAEDTSFG